MTASVDMNTLSLRPGRRGWFSRSIRGCQLWSFAHLDSPSTKEIDEAQQERRYESSPLITTACPDQRRNAALELVRGMTGTRLPDTDSRLGVHAVAAGCDRAKKPLPDSAAQDPEFRQGLSFQDLPAEVLYEIMDHLGELCFRTYTPLLLRSHELSDMFKEPLVSFARNVT